MSLKNQGIYLSPEFNFVVDVTETGVYFKEDMNWQGVESIFKTDTIVNVTAVVGKNGAGKTTLLKFLYQMHRQIKSCIPGAEGKFDLPENELIVVGRDEGSIVVFYNTGKENFYNETSYLSCQLKMDMFSDENVMKLYDLFDLFFTNSNYSSEDRLIEELKRLMSIIKNSDIPNNGYRPRDVPGYKDYVIINYDENKLNYKAFVSFIYELFNQDNVFVLRYIKFDNMGMSTGERAFQNLFSRLNLVPKMNTVIAGDYRYSNNYLLLIDEIDLYLHPEWQQEFISVLLSELENQFPDKKIQLVFSTHSPLLLSDIPKENTVYLRGNSGKAIVDNRSQHKQTFGRDIYNLLEDSFYIENYSMGKYALDYINRIINIMLDESHNYKELEIAKIETLVQRINLIGNDVVKNKLKTMLLQCTKDKNDYQIKLLKEKRDNLDRKIAELENSGECLTK